MRRPPVRCSERAASRRCGLLKKEVKGRLGSGGGLEGGGGGGCAFGISFRGWEEEEAGIGEVFLRDDLGARPREDAGAVVVAERAASWWSWRAAQASTSLGSSVSA